MVNEYDVASEWAGKNGNMSIDRSPFITVRICTPATTYALTARTWGHRPEGIAVGLDWWKVSLGIAVIVVFCFTCDS